MFKIGNKNFYIILAGTILVGYIFALIVVSIYEQKQIEKYQKKEVQAYAKSNAVNLEYFFDVLKNDVSNISENKTINTYFLNKALGMSFEYGLKGNLLRIDRLLEKFMLKHHIHKTTVFKEITILDSNNNVLSTTNKNSLLDFNKFEFSNASNSFFIAKRINSQINIFVLKNIFYKEKVVANIIALINFEEVFNKLLHDTNKFIFSTKLGLINSDLLVKEFNINKDFTKVKIDNTPFELLIKNDIGKESNEFRKWFLSALVFFAIPMLFTIYYLILLNNKNIKLNEDIKNSKKEKEQERLLLQQSKVAAVGEMLGNISHQWRQPLSIISTQATGLRVALEFDKNISHKEIFKIMDSINSQTQYLSRTIDDFRSFFKGNIRDVYEFNIKNTFERVESLTKDALLSNYIKYEYVIEDLKIKKNENILIQALINIYNNSKDAIVENNLDDDSRYLFVSAKDEDGNLVIKIKDSGGGIDEEFINKIFEPYFTTKHESIGTGIGLYMTNQIITKQFQGTISVSNVEYKVDEKLLKGAEFKIIIPL